MFERHGSSNRVEQSPHVDRRQLSPRTPMHLFQEPVNSQPVPLSVESYASPVLFQRHDPCRRPQQRRPLPPLELQADSPVVFHRQGAIRRARRPMVRAPVDPIPAIPTLQYCIADDHTDGGHYEYYGQPLVSTPNVNSNPLPRRLRLEHAATTQGFDDEQSWCEEM